MQSVIKAFIIFVAALVVESCGKSHGSDGGGLGLPTTLPSLGMSLKFVDGKYPPVIALDSTSISSAILERADFYYLKSTEGFDSIGEPTAYDMQLSSKGIVMDVQNSCDRLYVKVLGKCDGYADTCLEVLVRNWMFDRNYIAPQTLSGSYDGLELGLDRNYQEATAELSEMVTYPRVGYVGMNVGSATVRTILGGETWMYANFFGGSFKDTVFGMYSPEGLVYEITMPGGAYYYENSVKKSIGVGTVGKGDALVYSWSFKLWMEDMAVLEQQRYRLSDIKSIEGGSIEDLQ